MSLLWSEAPHFTEVTYSSSKHFFTFMTIFSASTKSSLFFRINFVWFIKLHQDFILVSTKYKERDLEISYTALQHERSYFKVLRNLTEFLAATEALLMTMYVGLSVTNEFLGGAPTSKPGFFCLSVRPSVRPSVCPNFLDEYFPGLVWPWPQKQSC